MDLEIDHGHHSPRGHHTHHQLIASAKPVSWLSWLGLALVLGITAIALRFLAVEQHMWHADGDLMHEEPMVSASGLRHNEVQDTWAYKLTSIESQRVVFYGWITAASTGLGALPFLWRGSLSARTMALCNCIAGGMMLSASGMLFWEGATHELHSPEQAMAAAAAAADVRYGYRALGRVEAYLNTMSTVTRSLIGAATGVLFILASKRLLARHEHLKVSGFEGADARRVILIVSVMFLHSCTEGIGLGVSHGSAHDHFGKLISATLAVHNIPEGLAVSLVMSGKGTNVVNCALWAIFTSLPQPIMALPSYLYVAHFLPVLPLGLGLAAGAMSYVAVFELLAEAREELGLRRTGVVMALSGALMAVSHHLFK